MKHMILALLVAIGVIFPAYACKGCMSASAECTLQENVTLSVTYNFKASSFAEAKKMFDDHVAKVQTFAKQQKLKKFSLQNQNYNIYAQPLNYNPDGTPNSFTYQINGSSSYVMDNADAAFTFAEFLTKQKMQVGLNSNSYRQGNCSNPVITE